jgi:hypothetical protein
VLNHQAPSLFWGWLAPPPPSLFGLASLRHVPLLAWELINTKERPARLHTERGPYATPLRALGSSQAPFFPPDTCMVQQGRRWGSRGLCEHGSNSKETCLGLQRNLRKDVSGALVQVAGSGIP